MEMREISTVNMKRNDVNPFNGIERLRRRHGDHLESHGNPFNGIESFTALPIASPQ
jgi:hypothetical protein